MKNFEKYIDKIFVHGSIKDECVIHHLRTKSCDCESMSCNECIKKSRQWLLEEYVEPTIIVSHDEYIILKNINKDYKWIGRCKTKDTFVFTSTKPYKTTSVWECNKKTSFACGILNNMFKFIQWEDEEAFYIPKLIKDYEEEHEDGKI